MEDKVKFVDELKEKWDVGAGEGQTRLVLLGHSIGAWVCCEVGYGFSLLSSGLLIYLDVLHFPPYSLPSSTRP